MKFFLKIPENSITYSQFFTISRFLTTNGILGSLRILTTSYLYWSITSHMSIILKNSFSSISLIFYYFLASSAIYLILGSWNCLIALTIAFPEFLIIGTSIYSSEAKESEEWSMLSYDICLFLLSFKLSRDCFLSFFYTESHLTPAIWAIVF